MSTLQNWSNIVKQVESANIDQHHLANKIQQINKRAYKQQLDREVQHKHYENAMKSAQKLHELQQAKSLAQAQRHAKMRQKHHKTKLHKHYGDQNRSLLQMQHQTKSYEKHITNSDCQHFLQHPFIKLVDGQDNRMKKLREKFIKQNEINHLQEQMKHHAKNETKYNEWQEKNQFIQYVEKNHQKRIQEREKFKNKYLRIKEAGSNLLQQSPPQSIQRSYITYLNNQILQNNERKRQQRSQKIDDPRLNQFYSSNKLEPDSSPAFLGRNPLSHERRRQLYYISKGLGMNHQRSLTAELDGGDGGNGKEMRKSVEYMKMAKRLNPQEDKAYLQKAYQPIRTQKNQSESLHMRSHLTGNREKMATQTNQRHQTSLQRDPFTNKSFRTQQLPNYDSNRRLKSELLENSNHFSANGGKLPQIYKQSQEPTIFQKNQRQPNSIKRQQKRQFFRYDPITGKQVSVYA